MTVFSVITLLGGLAFFLYGMHVMSSGLEKMSGSKLEKILKRATDNRFTALALGAGITIAIQSSSAMTVMLVGLVNSGIMKLGQTIGVIMGSNIGTTLTAWILSVAGIESDNILVNLLKPENFAPIFALVGIILVMMSKEKRKQDVGTIMLGFAVLMSGMTLMSDAMKPLADSPEFSSVLTSFYSLPLAPLLGVAVGAIFTGIIQSSAASVGILQALSLTGNITFGMALPVIMGQNIGTCVTAIISSIGVNKNAKRVSVIHILFNLIGTAVFLILFYGLNLIFKFNFLNNAISPVGIAAVHSVFNIATTVILFPFAKSLEKMSTFIVRDSEHKEKYEFLDERLISTPSFAISECTNRTVKMAEIARDTIKDAISLFEKYSAKKVDRILKNEDELDMYEDKLGTYLVKISSKDVSDKDSRQISKMLHTIGDFERLGDHAVNILKSAQEVHEKGLSFSDKAKEDLRNLTNALIEIPDLTYDSFSTNDVEKASSVEPLEQVIDRLVAEVKTSHISRLQTGECTIEMGFVLSDLLNNYERVSDHCSNIAVTMIEVEQGSYDTHSYLNSVKDMSDEGFNNEYRKYKNKYLS